MRCLVLFLLLSVAWPLYADEPSVAGPPPMIILGALPVAPKHVSEFPQLGQASAKPQTMGPFNTDHPPFTQIRYQDPTPGVGESYLTVYRISEASSAPYPTILPMIQSLRTLLDRRHTGDLDRVVIPQYPIPNAALCLKARTQYFDADWGSGIFYVAAYGQGNGDIPENGSLHYDFQGLSKDGKFYVDASLTITHPALDRPDYLDPVKKAKNAKAESRAMDVAFRQAYKLLFKAPDESFQPRLNRLRDWVATLRIKEPPQGLSNGSPGGLWD